MIPATTVPNRKLVDGRRRSGARVVRRPPPARGNGSDRAPVVVRGRGFDEIASDRVHISRGSPALPPGCCALAKCGWLHEFLDDHAKQFAHLIEHIQPLRPRQRLIGFFLIATIAVGIVVVRGTHQTYLSPKIFLNDPGARLCGLATSIHSGRRIAVATVRPPRTVGAGPDPHFITIRLRFDSEYLVSSYLWKSESKYLTGWSSDLQLMATIIVEGEQGSLHGTGNGRSGKSPGYMVPVATSSGPRITEGIPVIAKSAALHACRVTDVDIGSGG